MIDKKAYEKLQKKVKELEKEAEDRTVIEKELREKENKYRMFFEHAGFAIDLMDAKTSQRADFNRKAHESLGYTREEYRNIKTSDIEVKETPEDTTKHIEKIIKQGSDSFQTRLITKTGEIRDMFVSAVPILMEEKYYIQNIRIDITENKIAEEALKVSEERYRSLVESTEDFIYLVNPDCEYMFMNEKYLSRLNLSLDQVIGKSYADFHPKEDTRAFSKKIKKVIKTEKSLQHEHKSFRDNKYFLRTLSPIKNSESDIFSVTVVTKDITERKEAEEALRESAENIKLFAYSVSHDLKSPSVGIYGIAKLLARQCAGKLDEKAKLYIEQILKAAEQIASLVELINVYISTKETPLSLEKVRMKQILRMIRDEFSTQLNIRGIQCVEPKELPSIRVDRLSILRVIRNLIDNALKYGGDELSEIRIGYEKTADSHIFSVTDDGAGIKGKDYEKIFEFFQREESSTGAEGTGLGLAIVKEIIELHSGNVWVKHGTEKGMTFYVSISRNL